MTEGDAGACLHGVVIAVASQHLAFGDVAHKVEAHGDGAAPLRQRRIRQQELILRRRHDCAHTQRREELAEQAEREEEERRTGNNHVERACDGVVRGVNGAASHGRGADRE